MTKSITYSATFANGESVRFQADLSQAAAPILVEDGDGNWCHTQWQTADARHDAERAAMLLADDEDAEIESLLVEERLTGKTTGLSTVAAKEWYEAYGWHITTDEGDHLLQTVEFDDVRKIDDIESVEAQRLIDKIADQIEVDRDDAAGLVAKAIDVADTAKEVARLCREIVTAAKADDLETVRTLLDELSWVEDQHGDDPTASGLRAELIADAREIL